MQGGLLFRRTSRLVSGHTSVVSDREIKVVQANHVHRRIGRDEPVMGVSPGGNRTAVRVWQVPSGALGPTVYPAHGFIAPSVPSRPDLTAGLDAA